MGVVRFRAGEMDHNQNVGTSRRLIGHIAQVKGHIDRQRLIIDGLATMGEPTDEAWLTLAAFEGTLQAFERHRATILRILRTD